MNERIKDFLEQAHTYSFQENRGQFVLNDFAEKFAELIVGKCIAQCEQFLDDPDFTIGAMRCATQLNQYFGVKE